MKLIKNILLAVFAITSLSLAPVLVASTTVSAQTPQESLCEGSGGTYSGGKCNNGSAGSKSLPQFFKKLVNVLLFVIGAIAVIMVIVGGFRYVLSGGDQGAVTSAKNTILYAIVGLVVAILAYSLVNFVVNAFV